MSVEGEERKYWPMAVWFVILREWTTLFFPDAALLVIPFLLLCQRQSKDVAESRLRVYLHFTCHAFHEIQIDNCQLEFYCKGNSMRPRYLYTLNISLSADCGNVVQVWVMSRSSCPSVHPFSQGITQDCISLTWQTDSRRHHLWLSGMTFNVRWK